MTDRERLALDALDPLPRQMRRWIFIAASLIAAIGVGAAMAHVYKAIVPPPPPQLELVDKIRVLTQSLNSSATVIGEIEKEISDRIKLVDRLKNDAATAEHLASLHREQAEAIAQALKGQLRKQEQDNFWSSNFQALFWTFVGVLMTEVFHFVKRRLNKRFPARARGSQDGFA